MPEQQRRALYLDNSYIFRTSGGVETDPDWGVVLCATCVKGRTFKRPGDLRIFFKAVGVPDDALDRLCEYYLPAGKSPMECKS
ncbi:hypothetical protein [Roseivivax sp. THAF30]|uniref:hypothetical protein n=1 Tax=Roseivivax sp. THAF30 TaxID=2587852 RepID=UPI00126934AF|nr:hypothetical protein [Roseivivax sp. THAF30]QFT64577.1 hypothetical protein FIU91_16690 [Roseivivax sp. THAF30]